MMFEVYDSEALRRPDAFAMLKYNFQVITSLYFDNLRFNPQNRPRNNFS